VVRREADHSPPNAVEVGNMKSPRSTLQLAFVPCTRKTLHLCDDIVAKENGFTSLKA